MTTSAHLHRFGAGMLILAAGLAGIANASDEKSPPPMRVLFVGNSQIKQSANDAPMVQDWAQFRGPGGLGRSSETNLPVQWSDDKNLLWKAKLPGRGASSPIVVGDKIYLTCWSGAVTKKSAAGLTRHLLCFDLAGKLLLQKDVPAAIKDFPLK